MMLVMWYFEVRVSRSDLEASSYAQLIQRCFFKAKPSGVKIDKSRSLQK